MAAGSLKDAVKALEFAFAGPTVAYPLPDELQRTIETFLDKHHDIDDQDSQRLHDELLQTYNNHVQDEPVKRSAFLSVLRQVRPAIRGDARLSQWWNLVLKPVIDGVGHKRNESEDAREFVLGVLAYEAGGDHDAEQAQAAASYMQKLLDCYLKHTRMPTAESDMITPEDEYGAREIESLLVMYGRRKPKATKHRVQALGLLCTFVRVQPPHLYLVSETPLVENLEKCLMLDKSATVVEMALTVLIMFMPHITRVLVSHMPKLFLIYSRVLCWDQVTAPMPNESQNGEEEAIDADSEDDFSDDDRSDPTWERLEHAFDHPETSAPGALYYFTFIYGLFPVNLMSYVRKPRRFLKNINYLGADDLVLDPEAIRRRTEPFRQVHLLHPNFFNMTAEEELSETRWLRSDPADVVTECMSLCMAYPLTPTHARLAQNLATLQREVMLLRNDLNFERYLKAQHLSHIGQLQRRHIKEATVEAETQNLINTNRTLKAKLQKANELYAQLKKETITGRNQSKKWEGELGSKLKTIRDEQKQWHSEEASLKTKLDKAEKDCEHLRRLLVEAEARELNSKQNLKSTEVELEEMGILRQEIERLQAKLRNFELKELDFEQAQEEQDLLRNELKLANLKLDSQDAERSRLARAYDRKFALLESRQPVDMDISHDPTQLPASVQQMIDSALAASHSKFNQLRKTHNRLLHRFTELEMKSQALEAEVSTFSGNTNGSGSDKDNKAKITPKSEIRVYGRGGAQNVGKKKDGTTKSGTGGFRGFKGLMSQN
ncbi:putative tuberous sclerosis 1 [Diplodia seriata]|uniref:Putative tuberous sclerosis 1 n=1 Tax=Diplodia seriata TaxID=420778 RepID=A0A0G2EN47_9PEZI|nr:putative tuberous sclerosis 1 [Diplodia seriata]